MIKVHFLLLFLLQKNYAIKQQDWPSAFDTFQVSDVNIFKYSNEAMMEIPCTLSKFEQFLTDLKNKVSSNKSKVLDDIQIRLDHSKSDGMTLADTTESSRRVKRHLISNLIKNITNPSIIIHSASSDIKNAFNQSENFLVSQLNQSVSLISQIATDINHKIQNITGLMPQIKAIFPGTLWCGDGDIAKHDNDTGLFKFTDACCRQHDKCPFGIGTSETFGYLKNIGFFTRSACFCDREFYDCLKSVKSPIAAKIGFTYFTLLAPQCIAYDHPAASCTKHTGLLDNKCIEYSVDYAYKKILRWNNTPDF